MGDPNKILSVDDILAAVDQEIEPVDVPEWGGRIYVRSLTARERGLIEGAAAKFKETNGRDASFAESFTWRVAAMAICDASGQRLFTDDQTKQLADKNAEIVGRISEVAQRLSGLTVDALEELEKN